MFIAPPTGEMPGRFDVSMPDGYSEKITAKSFLTPDGWAGSAVIPWDAFENFTPRKGAEIGLGFLIGDAYGRKNNNPFFTAQYLAFGDKGMANDARKLHRWQLAEEFVPSVENNLENLLIADFQKLLTANEINAPIVMAEVLKSKVGKIDWHCSLAGKSFSGSCGTERLQINLDQDAFGDGTVTLTVRGIDNAVLGVVELPFNRIDLNKVQQVEKQMFALLDKVDFSKTAQNEPDNLAGIFGLLNDYEQLKRLLFLEKFAEIDELLEEMRLRIRCLQGLTPDTDDALFALLSIAGQGGQVSVEYPRYYPDFKRRGNCIIKFHAGGIPLARVEVKKVDNPEGKTSLCKKIALYRRDYMPTEDRSKLFLKCVAGGSFKQASLYSPDALEGVENIDAVFIGGNVDRELAALAKSYAAKYNIPIVKESELEKNMIVLCAGEASPGSALDKLRQQAYNYYSCMDGRFDLELQTADGLLCSIRCIANAGCELIAGVLQKKRAFTIQDNLELTRLVAAELQKMDIKPVEIPQGMELVAADIHCHTIYSDGVSTPLGLIAAALYSQMDFLMISDHETAEGVLDTLEHFRQYNWHFPLLCGEENSLPDGHFNSYPVTESIPSGLTFAELIAAAHKQGALVQYNHPATYSNRRDLQRNGIANVPLAAWEHQLPAYAKDWTEQPALTGSSDNHSSSFPLERTVTVLNQIDGKSFQNAVLAKQTGILDAASKEFVYGSDFVRGTVLTALLEPERYLNAPRRRRLSQYMLNSRIAELYKNIPGATPAELGK